MIDALLNEWETNRQNAARQEERIEAANMRLPLLSAEPSRASVHSFWNPEAKQLPEATLFFPYDKAAIRALESVFKEAGWKMLDSKMLPDYADYVSTWRSPDEQVIARLWFESNADGATCKRVEIGRKEIHYTQRIYEVVCPDQAQE